MVIFITIKTVDLSWPIDKVINVAIHCKTITLLFSVSDLYFGKHDLVITYPRMKFWICPLNLRMPKQQIAHAWLHRHKQNTELWYQGSILVLYKLTLYGLHGDSSTSAKIKF